MQLKLGGECLRVWIPAIPPTGLISTIFNEGAMLRFHSISITKLSEGIEALSRLQPSNK